MCVSVSLFNNYEFIYSLGVIGLVNQYIKNRLKRVLWAFQMVLGVPRGKGCQSTAENLSTVRLSVEDLDSSILLVIVV